MRRRASDGVKMCARRSSSLSTKARDRPARRQRLPTAVRAGGGGIRQTVGFSSKTGRQETTPMTKRVRPRCRPRLPRRPHPCWSTCTRLPGWWLSRPA
uniref:Uncharacterized protein n=1 Tax=Rhipicephalus zambeziensis TaxID=60191 RepID=A0A224YL49_9ACAR